MNPKSFLLTLVGEVDIKRLDTEAVLRTMNNNQVVMNWMWVVLIMTLFPFISGKDIFWGVVATFVLVFISSLNTSQKQLHTVLELRGR